MKKRIFHNTLILLIISALLLSISISFIFYGMSKEMHSIMEIFTSVLPVVAVITILILPITYIMARSFTKKIVNPLNNIDLDSDNVVVYDEFLPFFKKIEMQRNEISRQLADLENRTDTIKAIADNMKEGLILLDTHGVILSANISVMDIFREDDMLNKNIFHICMDVDLLKNIKLCLSGSNLKMLFENKNKKYNTYLNTVYNKTQISGAVILFLDTTESNYAEKQRREFSANVSHELKTPLTTISALSEMIVNGMVKEEDVTGFVLKISDQTNRLINIVDDIVKLSEFDEGNIRSEFSSFDLYALTGSVVSSLQDKADRKNVNVEILGEHLQITANERMMDELLFNLIDNGIKYNKEGGKVTVSLSKENEFYKISVADTGIGIPKEDHSRVFERFYRVDKSRSKKIGGTGLGLSIVKHIVEYHKGKIEMESSENVGTRITCFLL